MVNELVRELARFNYNNAVAATQSGHSENVGYFLDDAYFFATEARDDSLKKNIETNQPILRRDALKNEADFCIDRAQKMRDYAESDRMISLDIDEETGKKPKEHVLNYLRNARKKNIAALLEDAQKCLDCLVTV